ncbi:transaldolase [Corynebacterium sputi]|uniref:transaldolase n=1 Tax=Corynebacterium sputi TaxID=489915 RepID=UPI0003F7A0A5|nr:transaldolase [Corynebacterium sputi]
MSNKNLTDLAKVGTSTWLDDLSRDRLTTSGLQLLIEDLNVVGVTTNPAIFHTAMTAGDAYDEQLSTLTDGEAVEAVYTMAIDDVRDACDVFAPVHAASDGADGRVSIEVDPRYAADEEKTVVQAAELWKRVGRPNAMIKIPATDEGLPAITRTLAEGISVNVTLIFSVDRYRQVVEAYLAGLEQAQKNGHDLSSIHSVASFFVSRVDAEIDKRLDTIGSDEALALRGLAGVANARLAYSEFENTFSSENPRWAALAEAGANVQRPLWASTGVKNPDYAQTLYVTELAGPNTVNTMPEKTLQATAESQLDDIRDNLSGTGEAAGLTMAALTEAGIDLNDVFELLEREGVDKFVASWNELLEAIEAKIAAIRN